MNGYPVVTITIQVNLYEYPMSAYLAVTMNFSQNPNETIILLKCAHTLTMMQL